MKNHCIFDVIVNDNSEARCPTTMTVRIDQSAKQHGQRQNWVCLDVSSMREGKSTDLKLTSNPEFDSIVVSISLATSH